MQQTRQQTLASARRELENRAAASDSPKPPSALLLSHFNSLFESLPSSWLCLFVIAARTVRLGVIIPEGLNLNDSWILLAILRVYTVKKYL